MGKMDLEEAYDTIDRHGMWQILRVRCWWKSVETSIVCMQIVGRRVGMDVSEWFPVNVGLRHGCVMSPW